MMVECKNCGIYENIQYLDLGDWTMISDNTDYPGYIQGYCPDCIDESETYNASK